MDRITFHYIKSNLFRVIHIDGAHGGITPHGRIFAALFNERVPIPQVTVSKIVNENQLGEEIADARRGKEGIVREVEAGIEMDLSTAEGVHKWLGEKIEELRKIANEREKK